jgi:hypothetical protein
MKSSLLRPALLGLWAILLPAAAQAVAAEPPPAREPMVREIFVPFDSLDVLLRSGAERVFLTRQQYDELVARAARAPEESAPLPALLLSADYTGTVQAGRIVISGTLQAEVLAPGWHMLPLALNGVGIRSASLDGKPAALGRTPEGKVVLFLEGRQRHSLQLEMIAPLATSAAQQTLQVELPNPATARLRIAVPGNVDVRGGAAVVQRTVDEAAGNTQLELLVPRGPMSLVMSLNNRQMLREQSFLTRSVFVDEITQAYERLHATVALSVLHGAVEQLRFLLPAGFDVTEIQSAALAKWEVGPVAGQTAPVLTVQLREPTTEGVGLTISAVNTARAADGWQFPRIELLDAVSQVAVVGLLVDEQLDVDQIAAKSLIPIDSAVVRQALPETVFRAEPGAPRIRPVAAYYAPEAGYALTARFIKPAAEVDVTTNLVLTLDGKQQQLRGGFALSPRSDNLFAVEVRVPPEWQVTKATGDDGTDLPLDRFPGGTDGSSRLVVRFPAGVAAGAQANLFLQATRVPAGWLEEWRTQSVDFPVFSVAGAARDRGAIAVLALDDLSAQPVKLDGLTPLDEKEKTEFGLENTTTTLAYRYESLPYAATLAVERTAARLTARTCNFLRLDPEGLFAHYEIAYDVRQARVEQLSFQLPANTPKAVAIRGLDRVAVKESFSAESEGTRVWTVLLAEAQQGLLRLAIDFRQSASEQQLQDLSLPLVRANGVAYQSALVAVEGSPEFHISVETDARKVDVGELADADYEVGRRLLGSYLFTDGVGEVWVQVKHRESHPLPPTLVQRGELATLVSAGGMSVTAARFLLRSKASYLEVTLPRGARLWSATIDRKPSAPQRQEGRLLLSLPGAANVDVPASSPREAHADTLRDVQIVYEQELPDSRIELMGEVTLGAPQLVLQTAAGDRTPVPLADLAWSLYLPSGHRVIRTSGTVFTELPRGRISPLAVVAAALYGVAGGVQPWFILSAAAPKSAYYRQNAATDMMATAELESAATPEPGGGEQAGGMGYGAGGTPGSGAAMYGMPGGPSMGAPVIAPPEAPQLAEAEMQPAAAEPQRRAGFREAGRAARPQAERAANAPTEAPADPGRVPQTTLELLGRDANVTQQAGQSPIAGKPAQSWALEGVRSLSIDLDQTGDRVEFTSLGANPLLRATVVRETSLRYLSCALALLVGLVGIACTPRSLRHKVKFLATMWLLTLLSPVLIGWLTDLELNTTFEPAFYVACLLVPYYLLAGAIQWCVTASGRWRWRRPMASAATLVMLLVAATARGGEESATADLGQLLQLLNDGTPVQLPPDAVVIPYDTNDPRGPQNAVKVLVPYEKYVDLWNRAFPDQPLDAGQPPASFALAGASYQTTLTDEQDLLIAGKLEIESFVDGAVSIALPIVNGVLTQATLDGKPAQLFVLESDQPAVTNAQQPPAQAAAPADNRSIVALQSTGKGRKYLEFAVRMRLDRSGGWRIARGQLPTAPSTQLNVAVPLAQTEVRLSEVPDRELYETTAANESLQSSLGADGRFVLQWRPKVAVGQVDDRLTAQSLAIFDVQEDGLRLTWQLGLEFPGNQRDSFTLGLPVDYLLENVTGDNIRAWRTQREGNTQRVDVTLLKAATDKESLILHLARFGAIGQSGATAIETPAVTVADATLHRGQLVIRRSPQLDVRAAEINGLTRDTLDDRVLQDLSKRVAVESPLGVRPFETYRFVATSYQLRLSAAAFASNASCAVQALVKFGARQVLYEARVEFTVKDRPLYHVRLRLPANLKLEDLSSTGTCEWSDDKAAGQSTVDVYFTEGQRETFSLILHGSMPVTPDLLSVAIPKLQVLDVRSQEGHVVIQADPAYDVFADNLRGCDTVPIQRVFAWVNEEQRRLARLVVFYRTADHDATIRLAVRQPRVNAFSITNVQVTTREIQQSVYLEYAISEAGIREVSFLLPAAMEQARITVPLLRQKTWERVENQEGMQRVRLSLQDEVTGQLIVLVEHDQALAKGAQQAPIPVIENAEVSARYIVLESEGRDEVVVSSAQGLTPLSPQLSDWKRLAETLGSNITQAYVVDKTAQQPLFGFETKERKVVETAGAGIGLAQAVLTVDGHGVYRALQEYHVDNKTEQYLEVRLPAGAELWTVRVAGEAVKPTLAQKPDHVLIPLLKTAAGDLDYVVQLKYGGQLPGPRALARVHVPLPETINVNVELSQVRVFLPETHYWFDFGGKMHPVTDENDLVAGVLSYRTKQVRSLTESLMSEGNEFEKLRSSNNLRQLGLTLQTYHDSYSQRSNELLQKELRANSDAIADAQKELGDSDASNLAAGLGNRARLLSRYNTQAVARSKNKVTQLGDNFFQAPAAAPQESAARGDFNTDWFQNVRPEGKVAELSDQSRVAAGRAGVNVQRGQSLVIGKDLDERKEEVAKGVLPSLRDQVQELAQQQQAQRSETDRSGELQQRVERYKDKLDRQVGQTVTPQQVPATARWDSGTVLEGRASQVPSAAFSPDGNALAAGDSEGEAVQFAATGLASLDIELPQRGHQYLFTTPKPRGPIEITARAASTPHVQRLGRCLLVLAVAIGCCLVAAVARWLQRCLGRRVKATLLTVLGLGSLLTGIFPIAGLVGLITGIVLFFRKRRGPVAEFRPAT